MAEKGLSPKTVNEMHRRSLLNLFLAGFAFALPLGLQAAQVLNVRLWNTDDKLRLVLDLSGPAQYKTFSLTAPICHRLIRVRGVLNQLHGKPIL